MTNEDKKKDENKIVGIFADGSNQVDRLTGRGVNSLTS